MTALRTAAQQALEALTSRDGDGWTRRFARDRAIEALEAALAEPQRTLTDEVIAELWHKNGGFHHHFARAIERWLKGNP